MILTMDPLLIVQCQALKTYLDAGPTNWLDLYVNSVALNPDRTAPSAYVIATYTGYARFGILGQWSAVGHPVAGIYQLISGPWQFGRNLSGGPVTVYGWMLTRGAQVVMAEAFSTPLILPNGALGPAILLQLQVGSLSILCPGR